MVEPTAKVWSMAGTTIGRPCSTTWRTGAICIGRNSGSSRTGPCRFANPTLIPPSADGRFRRSGAGNESVAVANGRIMKNGISPACSTRYRPRRLSERTTDTARYPIRPDSARAAARHGFRCVAIARRPLLHSDDSGKHINLIHLGFYELSKCSHSCYFDYWEIWFWALK